MPDWKEEYVHLLGQHKALEQRNADLVAALKKIAKPEGAYSRDELTHARNTIANVIAIAKQALAAEGGE
jgi:hypothetical protein